VSRAKVDISVNAVRKLVAGQMAHGYWNTPIGMLALTNEISEEERLAGWRFADQRAAWEEATDCPKRNAPAQDLNRVAGRSGKPEDGDKARRAVDAYARAVVAVGGWSSPQHAALLHMAVDLKAPDDYPMKLALLDALYRLVRHYNGRS
jgi:hypothetical protein